MKLRRFLTLAMVLSLAAGLSACGGKATASSDSAAGQRESASESKADESTTAESKENEEVEGTPISLTTPVDYNLGTMPIHSEWLQFDKPCVVEDIFSPRIAAVGDYLIVLTDDKNVGKYKRDGGTLVLENSWTLDKNYEILSQGPDNTFFLSGFMSPMIQMDLEGNKLAQYDDADKATMYPDGKTGLVTWYGSTPEKLTLSDTNATREPVSSLEGYTAGDAGVSRSHMFLFGSAPNSDVKKVFVLDENNNVALALGGEESLKDDTLGAPQGILETDQYYVVLDGNLRKLALWDKEGNFAGSIDDGDLFGTRYPWICTATIAEDGTMYIGMTEGREEENSKDEFLIFTVSGF